MAEDYDKKYVKLVAQYDKLHYEHQDLLATVTFLRAQLSQYRAQFGKLDQWESNGG